MVAVAHTWTRARRTPVRMTGIASGSSTVENTLPCDIPMPYADSMTSSSTSVTPTYALVIRGGSANRMSAIRVARPARP